MSPLENNILILILFVGKKNIFRQKKNFGKKKWQKHKKIFGKRK